MPVYLCNELAFAAGYSRCNNESSGITKWDARYESMSWCETGWDLYSRQIDLWNMRSGVDILTKFDGKIKQVNMLLGNWKGWNWGKDVTVIARRAQAKKDGDADLTGRHVGVGSESNISFDRLVFYYKPLRLKKELLWDVGFSTTTHETTWCTFINRTKCHIKIGSNSANLAPNSLARESRWRMKTWKHKHLTSSKMLRFRLTAICCDQWCYRNSSRIAIDWSIICRVEHLVNISFAFNTRIRHTKYDSHRLSAIIVPIICIISRNGAPYPKVVVSWSSIILRLLLVWHTHIATS